MAAVAAVGSEGFLGFSLPIAPSLRVFSWERLRTASIARLSINFSLCYAII